MAETDDGLTPIMERTGNLDAKTFVLGQRNFMVLQFEHNNFFRNELKEQKSFMGYMNKELDDMSKEFYGLKS